jgi:hypothetical protein
VNIEFVKSISSNNCRACRTADRSERRKFTATPGTQWTYSLVSKASLQKTGVFLDSAGDFREFLRCMLTALHEA